MTNWLEGKVPEHPFFEQEEKIKKIAQKIKSGLLKHLIKGFEQHRKDLNIDHSLYKLINKNPLSFDLAIKVLRYGTIYWISRDEARKYHSYVSNKRTTLNEIFLALKEEGKFNRLINYAVHSFILDKQRIICFSNELIPPLAISSVGPNRFYVRKTDFLQSSPLDSFRENKAMYDLHDFAHAITSTLNAELYGSHYFDSLIYLPSKLRDLIKSHNYKSCLANPLSDGIVFSELSLALFDNLDYQTYSNEKIVLEISKKLAMYFLNKISLVHPSTNKLIRTNKTISTYELASLVQNKSYELPASEIEQKLFTRGGKEGNDPLKNLNASDRIEYLAESKQWFYFEMRNTLRHRAHKAAYRIVAQELLDVANKSEEKNLLQKIINNIDYKDFYEKKRINLWQEMLKIKHINFDRVHYISHSQTEYEVKQNINAGKLLDSFYGRNCKPFSLSL